MGHMICPSLRTHSTYTVCSLKQGLRWRLARATAATAPRPSARPPAPQPPCLPLGWVRQRCLAPASAAPPACRGRRVCWCASWCSKEVCRCVFMCTVGCICDGAWGVADPGRFFVKALLLPFHECLGFHITCRSFPCPPPLPHMVAHCNLLCVSAPWLVAVASRPGTRTQWSGCVRCAPLRAWTSTCSSSRCVRSS